MFRTKKSKKPVIEVSKADAGPSCNAYQPRPPLLDLDGGKKYVDMVVDLKGGRRFQFRKTSARIVTLAGVSFVYVQSDELGGAEGYFALSEITALTGPTVLFRDSAFSGK
jgi:hypothetical protein